MFSGTLGLGLPGGWEWIVILLVALLIFGRRLPEVGRSIGKTLVEFKKGMKGVQEEMREIEREADRAAALPEPPVSKQAASGVAAAPVTQATGVQ